MTFTEFHGEIIICDTNCDTKEAPKGTDTRGLLPKEDSREQGHTPAAEWRIARNGSESHGV